MSQKLYVGNLPYQTTEEEIQEMFEQYGTVESVKLIVDRETGKKKGYGFLEMDDEGAQAAITALNDSMFGGRNLKVDSARERAPRPRNSFQHRY